MKIQYCISSKRLGGPSVVDENLLAGLIIYFKRCLEFNRMRVPLACEHVDWIVRPDLNRKGLRTRDYLFLGQHRVSVIPKGALLEALTFV